MRRPWLRRSTIRIGSSNAVALAHALKSYHPDFTGKKVGEALEFARERGKEGVEFSLKIGDADRVLAELAAEHPDVQAVRVRDEPEEAEPAHRPQQPNRFNADDSIPPELLDEFPNWGYALDEEGAEGQDESTIKPAQDQSTIVPMITQLTAGDATFANLTVLPVLIVGFVFDGTTEDVQVVRPIDADEPRLQLVQGAVRVPASRAFIEKWSDKFPMRVESRLAGPDGKRIRFRLDPGAAEIVADP